MDVAAEVATARSCSELDRGAGPSVPRYPSRSNMDYFGRAGSGTRSSRIAGSWTMAVLPVT
jgi:hypothetical protein